MAPAARAGAALYAPYPHYPCQGTLRKNVVLTLLRTLVWQRQDRAGAEYFGLWRDGSGWQLRGTVVVALEGQPARVRYGVICDGQWRTRAVHVAMRAGGPEQALHLTVDEDGRWWQGEREVVSLRGCVDVDLAVTPATNTLPLRRLSLTPGQSADVVAAWVRFPALDVQSLAQVYHCLDLNSYRYRANGFVATLAVDELGLVTRYDPGWERVAARDPNDPGENLED